MPTTIDLTGPDIVVRASTFGGAKRLNLQSGGAALDLTGVVEFAGEILASSDSSLIGEGTALTWPVIDEPGGGISCAIPSGLTVGTYWCYVEATVDGDEVRLSGPLTITDF